MAAVMNVRVGHLTKNFIHASLNQCRLLKTRQVLYFHNSSLLNVKGLEIKMPSLSPTMSEGTIVKWLKKEGDNVSAGDVLCDIQTDKAVVSFEYEDDGILAKILVPENTVDIKVGTLIGLMVNQGEDWKNVEVPTPAETGPAKPSGSVPDSSSGSGPVAVPGAAFKTATLMSYGPAVRYLLEKYDIKADSIQATGRRSKLLKEDVLKHIKDKNLTEKPLKTVAAPTSLATKQPAGKPPSETKRAVKQVGARFNDLEISNMRKIIARRLGESKSNIPHSYGTIECSISKLLEFRKMLKSENIKVSVNDFVIKAAACALQHHPEVNSHWVNDKAVLIPDIDISIAVATPNGLITPIIKDVARKGIVEISTAVHNLASRAREGKLQPHEFQGGSFTISNLGMFGITEFSAIISPPQCAILAVGGGQNTLDMDGNPLINMHLTLSYDRRALDEQETAEFLRTLQSMLEDPTMMIVGGHQEIKLTTDI